MASKQAEAANDLILKGVIDQREADPRRGDEEYSRKEEESSGDHGGVVGSVMKTVRDTYEYAKEAMVGEDDEAARKATVTSDNEEQRGKAAKENILSAMPYRSVTEVVQDKLTEPTDVVRETRAAREQGGARRKDPVRESSGGDQ